MKFAGRMNSFMSKGDMDLYQTIEMYRSIEGITHLEFNYPEHIRGQDIEKIRRAMGSLKVNGVALRFKKPFINGEFTNSDETIRQEAIGLCKEAIDACRELGGEIVTIWQAYDGYDYPFQISYEKAWEKMINAFREIADYGKDLKISIEYKPFEPRNYTMLDSIGTVLFAEKEIDRPNIGVTLDFCHMLMKHDNPAYSLSLVAKEKRLFGLHLNDGYSFMDSGLIFGAVNLSQCIEFIYYLKRYNYEGTIFFDTFPVRENAKEEISANIKTVERISAIIDRVGMEKIEKIIDKNDGVMAQQFVMDLLK